jgi:hypothetical protein
MIIAAIFLQKIIADILTLSAQVVIEIKSWTKFSKPYISAQESPS